MPAFLMALAGLTLAPSAPASDAARTAVLSENRKAVLQVAERFRTALLAKDKTALERLFLPSGVAWFQVVGDRLQAAESGGRSRGQLRPGAPERFIADMVASRRETEERFRNEVVDTDGQVASLTFDYDFLLDGKIANSGYEMWQLVKVGGEWKICALTYSVTWLANG